jgi:hypothetical protein
VTVRSFVSKLVVTLNVIDGAGLHHLVRTSHTHIHTQALIVVVQEGQTVNVNKFLFHHCDDYNHFAMLVCPSLLQEKEEGPIVIITGVMLGTAGVIYLSCMPSGLKGWEGGTQMESISRSKEQDMYDY